MVLIRSILFALILAILPGTSPSVGLAAEQSSSSGASASSVPAVGIDNFGRINETYYRGSQPDGLDYADLAKLGVKTVIDLQRDGPDNERQLVESAGMTFYRIPMTTRKAPTSEDLAAFLRLVNDPANQPVYVHCAGGRHRTGVMTAVYRMTHDGWTPDQAFKEMKQYDFGASFLHPEFKRFVYAYRVDPAPGTSTAVLDAVNAAD